MHNDDKINSNTRKRGGNMENKKSLFYSNDEVSNPNEISEIP